MLKKKAQSALEYAVVIAVVVAALLAINIYMKRGIQGRMRQASDDVGAQFHANRTSIYSRTNITGGSTTTTIDDGVTTTTTSQENMTTYGNETVGEWD